MTGPGGNTDLITADTVRRDWGARYDIGYAGGLYLAIRLDAGNDAEPLAGATPGDLEAAMEADWADRGAS